jgi:myo-inositol-1(or 4)-monophosphatase
MPLKPTPISLPEALALAPKLCQQVCLIAEQAARYIESQYGRVKPHDIDEKTRNNLVSYVDKNAEQQIVAALRPLLPDAGFITEEDTATENGTSPLRWVIDPLDGTTNFLYHIPVFSVSIALLYDQQPIVGVVYDVCRRECFAAWYGGGAYLNGVPFSMGNCRQLSDAIIATGFPYYDFSRLEPYINALRHLVLHTRGVRRLGSAAIDLCYVACGRYDAFFEHALHAWDVAAGILITQEAGGIVSDFEGGTDYLFGKQIVAANHHLMPDFMHIMRQYFDRTECP